MANDSRNTHRSLAEVRSLLDDLELRPLSTRSLLLSFLLGSHPPEASIGHLVEFGERFGVRAGTVRTAISRLVAAGDVTADDGRYRLTGRLRHRQVEQDTGLVEPPVDWDGSWWTVLVTATDRSMTERRHFRSRMEGLRLGELRPDTWLRPANLPDLDPMALDGDGLVVVRGPLLVGDACSLVDTLWDLDDLESTAARLADAVDRIDDALAAPGTTTRGIDDALAETGTTNHEAEDDRAARAGTTRGTDDDPLPLGFELSAACVRFLRTEPRLPRELVDLPACRRLRAAYPPFNARFRSRLADAVRSTLA